MIYRVRVDRVGVLVPQEPWKVLTFWPLESLLVSVSNSLWTVIMRFVTFYLYIHE